MTIKNSHRTGPGMTLIEVLVVVVILAVSLSLLLPALVVTKNQRITCINNLKQIGTAFRIWQNDNANAFPMEVSTNFGGSKEVRVQSRGVSALSALAK